MRNARTRHRFDIFGHVTLSGAPSWDIPRSATTSRHIVDIAASHGLAADVCLSGTSITPATLADPAAEVEAAQELAIIRNVIAHLGDVPGLGIQTGLRYNLTHTGILGYAVMASPTMGDAVEVARRYLSLSALFLTPITQLTATEVVFVFDDGQIPADVRRFLLERDLTAVLRVMPLVFGRPTPHISMRLQSKHVALPRELLTMDGISLIVETDADRNAISFARDLLDQPMPAADPATAALCIRQCEDLLNRRRQRRGMSARIRMRLIEDPARIPPMDRVAEELCVTARTLHRRLAAEGTSFRSLVDEVRSTLAAELLDSGFTVEETARRLGYSESAAFTHAHIRWTGHPPTRRHTSTAWPDG